MLYRRTTASKALPAAGGAVAVWSTNAVAAQYALRHASLWPVLVAMTAGATATLLIHRLARRDRPAGSLGRPAVLAGLLGLGGTLVLQYVAFDLGPLLDTNVTSYGWPMFAALAVAVVQRSRAGLWALGCALVGFAGVALMFSGSGGGGGGSGPWGYVAALASALCMAGYTVAVPRLRAPLGDVLLVGAVAGLLTAVAGLAVSDPSGATPLALLAAAYCGVGPVATGYLLWSHAMVASAGRLAPLGYAIPLLSTALLLFAGATLTARTGLGALLVVACTVGVLVGVRAHTRNQEGAAS